MSGLVFNVASHAQLRSVLYQELKLDLKARVTIPHTAKGQKSTSETAVSGFFGSCLCVQWGIASQGTLRVQ